MKKDLRPSYLFIKIWENLAIQHLINLFALEKNALGIAMLVGPWYEDGNLISFDFRALSRQKFFPPHYFSFTFTLRTSSR